MEITGNRFAIIGGAGFIGSHVVDRLLADGAREVIVFDDLRRGTLANLADSRAHSGFRFIQGSIGDAAAVSRAIRGVDGVFLLAALWLDECLRDPRAAWEINALGTWNVVEACRENGMPKIVFSSSASVYGNAESLPMTEDHPLSNRTVYGATKIAGEQMLRSAATGWGQGFLGLRYMNVFGPRMDDRGAYVSVIIRMLARLDRHEAPVVYGDGSQTFDFIDVTDAARANVRAMACAATDEFVNIGTGRGTSIAELAELLLSLTGSTLAPRYEAAERQLVTTRVGSTEKARTLLGFEAEKDLRDGLRDLLRWWRSRPMAEARA